MATKKYVALRDTWISHECRILKSGQEIETEFPRGMKLSGNLQEVKAEPKAEPKANAKVDAKADAKAGVSSDLV